MPESSEAHYRLPRTVIPSRYELTVEPDLDRGRFAGEERVTVEVVETVSEVVLNAAELELADAWLEAEDGGRLDATVQLDAEAERATLALDGSARAGRWTVHLAFRGQLSDRLKGFYRSTFTDDAGRERVIATTQMEPTDARRAFPCWDEPDLKAVFAVTLVVAEGTYALSNAALVDETRLAGGRVARRFADTIPMSTYLVAFVVGPLEATDPVDVDGVPLRVVHAPGKGHLTRFALDVGAFCLRHFSGYYGIPYPGDKVDLVALPDFAAGAMENLGAITFREALLLVDPAEATKAELQRVADVVAHELAHMWFGDLVTMRWWNGLWLNEAFATFMELLAVDAFKPEWERWVSFSLERSVAMDVDALASTRPIEFPVRSPAEAEGMFDVLTYQKGASVLRMLEQYVGDDAFRKGIRRYLDEGKYGNADTTDLWDAIEAATGEPVRRIMDAWIFQGGYPVVAVERRGPSLTLSQRRFRYLADGGQHPSWPVPVMLRVGESEWRVLLDGPSLTLDADGPGPVVVNAGGHGFYRVRYSPELLAELGRSPQTALRPVERYLLVDDTWASVLAGDTTASDFCSLVAGFADEGDRTVWAAIIGGLSALDHLLPEARRAPLQAFVRRVVGPAFGRLGWEPREGEDDLTRQLRGTLLSALGVLSEDAEVVARAREVHERYRADAASVDPNVAAAVTNVVAAHGTADDYAHFLHVFRTSASPQESLRYLYALAAFREEDLARRTLAMTLTPEIRSQNAPFVVLGLLQNRTVGPLAWRFVEDRWDAINERFPSNSISRFLSGIAALSEPDLAADVEAFLAAHPVPQGEKQVAQHLERLRVNVALRAREADRLPHALR